MCFVLFFFFFPSAFFACLPEVPAEPTSTTPTPPPPPTPLAGNSEQTLETPAPVAGMVVTENRTVASPGAPAPVTTAQGQTAQGQTVQGPSRTQAEQASGTAEAVVLRRKSKPPQRTLNSIPDEDGFEEDEVPGESAALAEGPVVTRFIKLFIYSSSFFVFPHPLSS